MIKKILIGVLGLIVVLVIIGFVLPGKFEITRSEVINAPSEFVFEEINDLEKWGGWSYWHSLDPNMKITYGQQTSGNDATYEWVGNSSVGEGKLTITESNPTSLITADLFFMQSDEPAKVIYTFEPNGDSTKLTMSFSTDLGMNPLMRWMGTVMFPSEMEKAFDHNLSKLKEIAEAKPKFTVQFSEEATPSLSYVGIAVTAMSTEDIDAMSAHMAKSYGELAMALGKAKVEITGPAFCIIDKWDEATKQTDFTCAFPVAADAKVPAKYAIKQTTSAPAIKATSLGSYNNLGTAHEQMMQYLEYKKLELNGSVLEVYVTDPEMEKDTTKWITEIYYPIKQQ